MKSILNNFKINSEILSISPYGEGHINDTFLIVCTNNERYILQRINHKVFKDIDGLMNNIDLVTKHLCKKVKDINKDVLHIINTNDDKLFYYDKENDNYYRVYSFVKGSITLQQVSNKEIFKETAIAFGKFQNYLADFDSSLLNETIANFHNSKVRYDHFINTLSIDKYNRAKNAKKEIEFIIKRKDYCSRIIDLIEDKKIPLRVTHNDTKLNNVLFDEKTYKALCVIDLDTIMPGSTLYDFADSIRFGCNMASEDCSNIDEVKFSIEYFKAYAEGFLQEVKESLNQYEIDNLAFSAILITLECGIRFLDDYLDGDNYFKISKEDHNLIRCKTQLKLVEEMEKNYDLMNSIVHQIYNNK